MAVKGNKGELHETIVDYFDDKTLAPIKAREECYSSNIEKRYYIMSIFDAELFARIARKKWMVENNLHWYLDYTLKEDSSTIIAKKIMFNLNIIRKAVLTMFKNVEFKKKFSLKNKITYINDNFTSILPDALKQLSISCK